MSLTQLLLSYKGPIRRLHWWVGSLAAGAATGLITAILELAARSSGHSAVDRDTQHMEPIALSVKHLHDRDRQRLVAYVPIPDRVAGRNLDCGGNRHTKGAGAALLCARGWHERGRCLISIWLCVKIGFVRGTQGPNRFGPDPLDATKADAQL